MEQRERLSSCPAARFAGLLLWGVTFSVWASGGLAADLRGGVNKGVVELEITNTSGIAINIADDLAVLYDDGATRRIVPVVGRTATQNLFDLTWLHGIDMAIIQTDVVDAAREQRSLNGIEKSFSYVTSLYNEEFHLLAGSEVKTVGDLAHRRVIVGTRGSGTSVTALRLFSLLRIPIEPVYERQDLAFARLRQGDVMAVAMVAGKPAAVFQTLQGGEQLHFVPVPLEDAVVKAYAPTRLDAADYPGLIAKDQAVETVAVGSVLAVAKLTPGSERYRNVSNFVDVLFTGFATLLEPGHQPKWRDVNLAAELPGWTRFPPAQQWLDRNSTATRQNPQDVSLLFSRFLDTRQQSLSGPPITDQQKQDLFNQFQRWQNGQNH